MQETDRKTIPVHPFLVAAFPPLAIFAQNFHGVMWWEFLSAMVACQLVAAALYLLFGFCYQNRDRAAMAASFCFALLAGFGLSYQLNGLLNMLGLSWRLGTMHLLIGLAVMLVLVVWRFSKSREDEVTCTRFAHLFTALALCGPLYTVVMGGLLRMNAPEVATADEPEIAELTLAQLPAEQQRDIYYLVFDRYASNDTLEGDFEYNNEAFLQALEARGFTVARNSKANYPKTDLSMASALNMQYHGAHLRPKKHYLKQLHQHEVGRQLQEQGYRYFHYGTLLDGIRANPNADVNFYHSPMPSEYTDILYQYSVLHAFAPGLSDRQQAVDKFAAVRQVSNEAGPKFVYAHFLVPHYPWKFNADGSEPTKEELSERSHRESYVEQLKYTNRSILLMIDEIRANSTREPIIVLQADEGPELMYEGDAELNTWAQMSKRQGVLSAFFLPERESDVVPQDVSPVNTFRLIFREYFAANCELLPERCFYWEKEKELGRPSFGEACRFVDVTEELKYGGEVLVAN